MDKTNIRYWCHGQRKVIVSYFKASHTEHCLGCYAFLEQLKAPNYSGVEVDRLIGMAD